MNLSNRIQKLEASHRGETRYFLAFPLEDGNFELSECKQGAETRIISQDELSEWEALQAPETVLLKLVYKEMNQSL